MQAVELKQQARRFGADLVGVADSGRFDTTDPERAPQSIFPECRSVIVLGRRVLRGSLRGVEEGSNFNSTYTPFGFHWLEDNFLSQTTYDLTCWIEEQGAEAVPLFGYREEGMPKGRPVAAGKPAPNVYVDMDFAAAAAGLGEIGLADVFLTPEFGPRQRFAMILTDAELDPDPVRGKSLCGDCGACIRVCPFGAIDASHMRTVELPGCSMDVAKVDFGICARCPNGAMTGPGRGSRPDRLAAACIRACMVKLETAGKTANRFEQPFRKRTPWLLDGFNRPLTESSEALPGCDGAAARKG